MSRLRALVVGPALDLEPAAAGVVHSVFTHAVNLEVRGNLWTLLARDRDDLPFGVRLATETFDGLDLRRGDPFSAGAGLARVHGRNADLVLDCRAAGRWIPAHQPRPMPGLDQRLAIVAAAARERAWPNTLPMARAVVSALSAGHALPVALARAIGCGPGSTPSGDDAIVGIFAVLASSSSGTRGAAALRDALHPLLPSTTNISAHLLRQAAAGWFSRAVHALCAALVGAEDPAHMSDATRHLLETGASSGADLCMGMLAAAPEFLPRFQQAAA